MSNTAGIVTRPVASRPARAGWVSAAARKSEKNWTILVGFLLPELGERISALVVTPTSVGELWMVSYLLVIGVKTAHPTDRTPVAA